MPFLIKMCHQDRKEWDAEIEPKEASCEVGLHHSQGNEFEQQFLDGEFLIASQHEDREDDDIIEFDFEEQLQELPQGDGRLAHKVARDEHKAVDARLSPHTEDIEELALGCNGLVLQFSHQAGIDDIVMAYDEQHHDDAV